jgi:hypothetical protein
MCITLRDLNFSFKKGNLATCIKISRNFYPLDSLILPLDVYCKKISIDVFKDFCARLYLLSIIEKTVNVA